MVRRKSTLEVLTIGNPVGLVTKTLAITGIALMPLSAPVGFLIGFYGIGHELLMTGGWQLNKHYQRTLEHIEKFKRLDPRFFQAMIKKDRESATIGYCQLQGMFLAAKQYGLEKEFFEYKRAYTNNLLPNL